MHKACHIGECRIMCIIHYTTQGISEIMILVYLSFNILEELILKLMVISLLIRHISGPSYVLKEMKM